MDFEHFYKFFLWIPPGCVGIFKNKNAMSVLPRRTNHVLCFPFHRRSKKKVLITKNEEETRFHGLCHHHHQTSLCLIKALYMRTLIIFGFTYISLESFGDHLSSILLHRGGLGVNICASACELKSMVSNDQSFFSSSN